MNKSRKQNIKIDLFVCIIMPFVVSSFDSCKKIEREPKVETGVVSDITTSSAKAEGSIIDIGKGINNHGHCWSITPNPDIYDSRTMLGAKTNTGTFISNLTDLNSGTTYYIRAYACDTTLIVYGQDIIFSTLSQPKPENGLVAYYPFSGNANDLSGFNNNGTVYGATLALDRHGAANQAYSFDGLDDFIRVNNSPSLNFSHQISISFWAKFNKEENFYYPSVIIDKYQCWSITTRLKEISWTLTTSNGQYSFWTFNFELNRFYHFVMIYDGSKLSVYVDGILQNSLSAEGLINQNVNDIYIGRHQLHNVDYFFDGTIDDLRIYNRALSSAEIISLRNE